MSLIWKFCKHTKVRCLYQCSKMQFITFQNFHIQTWFSQFLWFFSLKCWFKGQMISRIHLILPNAYKLMCFDRNINGNRDVKFLECDKWSLHWSKNLTLIQKLEIELINNYISFESWYNMMVLVTAKRNLERLQFSTSSSFVKIWSACSCEFKAYFWT